MPDSPEGTVYKEPEPPKPGKNSASPSPPLIESLHALRAKIWLGALVVLLLAIALYHLRPQPPPKPMGAGRHSIAISENGAVLAVATVDGALRLISVASGDVLARAELPSSAQAVAFGPNDAILVLANDELYIYARDLSSESSRDVNADARDMVWSAALDSAIVVSGGADDLHPALEFFPAQPLGLAHSTSQAFDLTAWSAPECVAAAADGSRVTLTLKTARRANVIFYDPAGRRVAGASLVAGVPEGIALAHDGASAWVVSPSAETITEITARKSTRIEYPKSASTSPLHMIAVDEAGHRAYTSGSPTFPQVDLEQQKIIRTFELPTNSAGIVLSPDGATAYLTFKDQNKIGVLKLNDMSSYREIQLR